jgi:transcriptional regulator with XRE-family HTH domain
MDETEPIALDDGRLRSAAVKAVRRLRGLSAQDAAAALNLPLRTYEHFEAGHGRLNLDYLHRFSEATDSDFYGLLHAIAIGSPEFAVRTADNKFMTAFTIFLQAYDRQMGDRIRDLDARALIAAFGEMFEALAEIGERRADEAASFLREGRDDLTARRPKPGR